MKLIRFLFISACLTLTLIHSARAEIQTLPPMYNNQFAQESETRRLIVNAERAIKAFRLTKPHQNNALFHIEAILSLAPKNKRIHTLLIDVIQAYKKLAHTKIDLQQNEAALILSNNAQKIAEKYNISTELKDLSTLNQTIKKNILRSNQIAKANKASALSTNKPRTKVEKKTSQPITKANTHLSDSKKKRKATKIILSNTFSAKPEMVTIPVQKGNFTIGTPILETRHESNEKQNRIPIPAAYALGRYEVTLGEFRTFVLATQYSNNKNKSPWNSPNYKQSNSNPVVNVSWNDAMAYISWLNKKYPVQNFRLPTEAEWEFAARGNTDTARYWGNDTDEACRYANVYDQTLTKIKKTSQSIQCNDHYAYTAPVNDKQFTPNAFGLYHILGNVREWTCSSYNPLYLGQEQQCVESPSTRLRVLRGGSWADKARHIRSGDRSVDSPETFNNKTGFRLARTL